MGIPTCDDDPRVLRACLDAIVSHRFPASPLIVDMSRSSDIRDMVQAHHPLVRYRSWPSSRGVADSRNRIIELADTRFVLFIDADAVPQPGWAQAMAAAFDSEARIGMVGARILPAWPSTPPPLFSCTIALELLGMLDLGPKRLELPRVMGTSYALDRELLPDGAAFRVDLGRRPGRLLSGEEVQLSLDVRARGGRIRYEPSALVHHHVRPERLSWRWMFHRLYSQGQETRLWPRRLEPFPRPLTARDRAFQIITTPAFQAGRLRGGASG